MNTELFLVKSDGSIPTEAAPEAKNVLKVGDILVGSTGYEASISCFYEVVSISATGKTAQIVELEQNRVYDQKMAGMYWTSTPIIGSNLRGNTETKKINYRDGNPVIKIRDYLTIHRWNGQPRSDYNVH